MYGLRIDRGKLVVSKTPVTPLRSMSGGLSAAIVIAGVPTKKDVVFAGETCCNKNEYLWAKHDVGVL